MAEQELLFGHIRLDWLDPIVDIEGQKMGPDYPYVPQHPLDAYNDIVRILDGK
jgi:hypothetical protein